MITGENPDALTEMGTDFSAKICLVRKVILNFLKRIADLGSCILKDRHVLFVGLMSLTLFVGAKKVVSHQKH